MSMDAEAICIKSFADIDVRLRNEMARQMDDVFFTSAGPAHFADASERRDFHSTWLGSYREAFPSLCLIAVLDDRVTGYLVGSLEPPASEAGFKGQFHVSVFRDHWARFPAHLHINVAPEARSRRVGEKLVDDFAVRAGAAGCLGVHIVTGAAARNAGFYRKCGFSFEVRRQALERDLLFMGRPLAA